MKREVPLRIAIVGSASTGKSSLAKLLAEKLGVVLLDEDLRRKLEEAEEGPLETWSRQEASDLLLDLHGQRLAAEQKHGSFVADTSCLDPMGTGLHLGLWGPSAMKELREARRAMATYDAVFVLPWGVLPYECDGVRANEAMGQLAYHHQLMGLLGSCFGADKIFAMPQDVVDLEARAKYVLDRLEGRGLLAGSGEAARAKPARVSKGRGKVYLVGAGPGSPDLLTLRAADLIRTADVIAHDRLVPPALLAMAKPGAELLAVGHRGRGSKQVQYRLHPAVLERAERGLRVVRLKAGDPLIFGRGGEEAEVLVEAGIAFEIVPGISAALGAAAAAGIPLTHRDHASDVTFATGHDLTSGRENRANWRGMAEGKGTLVLYMATRKLAINLEQLVKLGRAASTPAAYVASAARHDQVVVTGTLADLAGRCADVDRSMPALVIVGDVVTCRARIAWCEQRPLAGRRFLLGRGRPGPSDLAFELRELGATVVEEPLVETEALSQAGALDACILDLEASLAKPNARPAVLLVASAEAARRLVERWLLSDRDLRDFPAVPLLALGPKTGAALRSLGLAPAAESEGHCIDGLAAFDADVLRAKVWVVGGDSGRPSLMDDLKAAGWNACFIETFKVVIRFSGIDPGPLDASLFLGSSMAKNLMGAGGVLGERLKAAPAFAIGPKTQQALSDAKHRDIRIAAKDKRSALIEVLLVAFASKSNETVGA